MSLQVLKVSECYESETNPRGANFANAEFKELVASVKEKGVLVPVLARTILKEISVTKRGMEPGIKYEIIAGNRRLRAAMVAGLQEIPAQVVKMTDSEAREAQIVENLQRADVHPLEEGEAYRQLLLDGKKGVSDIAIAVGKSETYIRDRLFLTNLIPSGQKAYQSAKILDGHAVLIAKLSEKDQAKALTYATDEWDKPTVAELKKWIEREFYSPMERQPWLKDKAFMVAHAHAKDCQPDSIALFADFSGTKAGACDALDCWKTHMTAWIGFRTEKVEGIIAIATSYGRPATKGALEQGKWQPASGKKNSCKLAVPAIFVEGVEIGKETTVCANAECKKHWGDRKSSGIRKLTPEEKETRKKQKEEEAKQKAKDEKDLSAALARVTWPMTERQLGALLDILIENINSDVCKEACVRRAIKVPESDNHFMTDYDGALAKAVKAMTKTERLQLVFELLIGEHVFELDLSQIYKSL